MQPLMEVQSWCGSRQPRHVLYHHWEGIGGAIILDGKLWTGASGFAGEFGHITIDAEGIECECGNTGCLETLASAPSIVRRANDRLYRDGTSSLSGWPSTRISRPMTLPMKPKTVMTFP